MAAPTVYDSEEALAAFMLLRLGKVAEVLGWDTVDDLQEPLNDALLAYGVTDVTDATDIPKIRAVASLMAWRAAIESLATYYSFTRPNGSYSRSDMYRNAREALTHAEEEAAKYGIGGAVVYANRIQVSRDPYPYRPRSEWD